MRQNEIQPFASLTPILAGFKELSGESFIKFPVAVLAEEVPHDLIPIYFYGQLSPAASDRLSQYCRIIENKLICGSLNQYLKAICELSPTDNFDYRLVVSQIVEHLKRLGLRSMLPGLESSDGVYYALPRRTP